MQQCTHCQAALPQNAQFCNHCGTPVDENQALSTPLAEAQGNEEDLESTSKLPVVAAPASPSLPTLRTRRMHPQSSISEFPAPQWVSYVPSEEEEQEHAADGTHESENVASGVLQVPLTPPIATEIDAEEMPETPLPVELPAEEWPPASFIETQDASALSTAPLVQQDESEESTLPEAAASVSHLPTGALPQTPMQPPTEISTSPTGSLPPQSEGTDPGMPSTDNSTALPEEAKYASPFPLPTPEKRSTPRPENFSNQLKRRKTAARRSHMLLPALLLIAIVLVGAIGAFVLLGLHPLNLASSACAGQTTNCASGSPAIVHGQPTHLTFAGSVAGPLLIVAKPSCQHASAGNLRTLTVNLSGTINNQLYNFGFVIARYHGAGTYSDTTATITVLLDTPGQSTTNGWSNSTATDTGTITVARGEETGTLSYALSGVGTHANTQVQVSGNWTCGA